MAQRGRKPKPTAVKVLEGNLRAKSLKNYQEKFSPEVSIRTSMTDYKKEEWLINSFLVSPFGFK